MHRMLYTLEDILEDRAHDAGRSWWLRRLFRSAARTAGEVADLVALR